MISNANTGLKAKASLQPAISRDLKSVGKKASSGGVLHERTGSQLNKKAPLTSTSVKKTDPKQQSLFGFKGFGQISKESSKTFDVFNDENKVTKSEVAADKTDTKSGDVENRLVQTDITGDYTSVTGHGDLAFYKELAERRREALNDSLKENESLCMENTELKHENFELKNENQSLLESVEKANRLAEMLEPLFSKTDDDDEETSECVETKDEREEKREVDANESTPPDQEKKPDEEEGEDESGYKSEEEAQKKEEEEDNC